MKTLVIAEKPSVGRDIARVLGCKTKGDGSLFNDEYIVSWAIGHLVTLKEPDDYNPVLKKWSFALLPIIPDEMGLKPIQNTKKQLNVLKKLLRDKDTKDVICATDSGREGELIFRYIYDICKCDKPVKRLWISSMTDKAIQDGFAKMKDAQSYDNLYASAKCRSEADWLVGMNATRAFSIRYGSYGNMYSIGRVQTPTLAILVNRQQEIDQFVPEAYYEIFAEFEKADGVRYKGVRIDAEGNTRVSTEADAKAIAEKVKSQAGRVASVETEEKRQVAPQLFDLTSLQRECNQKLGFSAAKTLEVAQSLYEKYKLITYPRTDSRYLSQDMVPTLMPTIEKVGFGPYAPFAQTLTEKDKLPITKRIVDDAKVTDHHAIMPTGKLPPPNLPPDEKKVFDRIVRNFLAAFYPAYVYDITTVMTCVAGETFRSKGKVDKQPGWTELYAHEKKTEKPPVGRSKKAAESASDDTETDLPALVPDEAVHCVDAELQFKKTKPPSPYTESALLSAMENAGRFVDDDSLKEAMKGSGLGTPATRAAIIERLISIKYVERKKKSLIPTEKGITLIGLVPNELKSPETTGKWEKGLSKIAAGEMDAERFMESIKRFVGFLVDAAKK